MTGVLMLLAEPQMQMFSDASLEGWGGHLENWEGHGEWSDDERFLHSNALELLAVIKMVEHFKEALAGETVLLLTDNTSVVAYVNHQGGTKSRTLLRLTQRLYLLLEELQLTLRSRHIPGRLNVLADKLSRHRQIVPTEWSLHPSILKLLWGQWDKPLIDLFATRHNKKLPLYVSPVPDREAWAVDALSLSWDNLYAYAYPPTAIVGKVLAKVEKHSCILVLIAPAWPNQAWYPKLLDLLIETPLALPVWEKLLRQPQMYVYHRQPEIFQFHAWKISSDPTLRGDFLRSLQKGCPDHRKRHPWRSTKESGQYSRVGVINGMSILPRPLLP
jgi:hypothetical protein